MSEAIILPQFPPDLSGYALTTHTHTPASIGAAASSHSHSGYASSSHSHSGYATTSWVSANFAPKGSGGGTTGGDSGTTGGTGTYTYTMPSFTKSFSVDVGAPSWGGSQSATKHFTASSKYSITMPSIISSVSIAYTAFNITLKASSSAGGGGGCTCMLSLGLYDADIGTSGVLAQNISSAIKLSLPITSAYIYNATSGREAQAEDGGGGNWSNGNSPQTSNITAATYTIPAASVSHMANKTMHLYFKCVVMGDASAYSWQYYPVTKASVATGEVSLNTSIGFTISIK